MRKLFAAIACVVLPVALGGCVVFTGPTTGSQQDVIGKVRVNFAICPSETPEDPAPGDQDSDSHNGCPDTGNAGSGAPGSNDPTFDDDYQVMLAFRVPVGTSTPGTFAAGPGSTLSDTLAFRRSTSYTRSLTESVPPPAGLEWAGYISDTYTHDDGPDNTPAQRAEFSIDFGLPPAAGGTPFAGPFRIRPVVGGRLDNGEPNRPVSCGDDPFELSGGSVGGSSICIDAPTFAVTGTSISIPTRDLAIAPGNVEVSPGQTAAVPFNANLNGTLPAGTTFSTSAATNVPGVTVAASPAAFTPAANSSTRITVPVAIPKTAGPGTFDVGLTARLPNGQARAGVAKLTVRDRQKPVASRLSVKPKTLRPQAPSVAAPARVAYRLSEAAKMSFKVQRCRKVRKGKRRRTRCRTAKGGFSHAGGAGSNRFRFTGFLRNRALKPGSYRLVGTPTDPAKNKGKSVKTSFRIKR